MVALVLDVDVVVPVWVVVVASNEFDMWLEHLDEVGGDQ